MNGNSEYIISDRYYIIQVNQTGTMDNESIRQEICDVMKDAKDAFEMGVKNIIPISRNNWILHIRKFYIIILL